MATFNGIMRSANASYKRAARANERYEREKAKQRQLNLKEQIRHENITAVRFYNDYIDMLTAIHKDCSKPIDWRAFLNEPQPDKPKKEKRREELATFTLNYYKPSIIAKLFGQETKKRNKLKLAVEAAIAEDLAEFNKKAKQYEEDLEDWETVRAIAKGVLAEDLNAYKEAISFFNPFTNISELGTSLNFIFSNTGVIVNVSVNHLEVIPDYILTTTTTGKLSNKKMPITRFHEYYQDYVCSCAIRVAREIFALLPINCAQVNAIADLLDSSTGRISPQPILSCKFIPDNLARLNYDTIDCSDAMRNFVHIMKFSKTNGFSPINLLRD